MWGIRLKSSIKKRIYINILCLVLPAVLLLSALLSWFFYTSLKNREMAAVRENAGLIAELLNHGVERNLSDYTVGGSLRITVVHQDGTVLLDSQVSADTMENHGDRSEVLEALQTGSGEAIRYSGTLSEEMFYRAMRLDDGRILRLSKTIRSIAGVFGVSLPVVLLVTLLILFLAYIFARRLTEKIVKPLGQIGFEGESAEMLVSGVFNSCDTFAENSRRCFSASLRAVISMKKITPPSSPLLTGLKTARYVFPPRSKEMSAFSPDRQRFTHC